MSRSHSKYERACSGPIAGDNLGHLAEQGVLTPRNPCVYRPTHYDSYVDNEVPRPQHVDPQVQELLQKRLELQVDRMEHRADRSVTLSGIIVGGIVAILVGRVSAGSVLISTREDANNTIKAQNKAESVAAEQSRSEFLRTQRQQTYTKVLLDDQRARNDFATLYQFVLRQRLKITSIPDYYSKAKKISIDVDTLNEDMVYVEIVAPHNTTLAFQYLTEDSSQAYGLLSAYATNCQHVLKGSALVCQKPSLDALYSTVARLKDAREAFTHAAAVDLGNR